MSHSKTPNKTKLAHTESRAIKLGKSRKPPSRSIRGGTKQAAVLAQLEQPKGATIAAIMTVTGWQQHSVRGFSAGVVRKKLGLTLASEKVKASGSTASLPASPPRQNPRTSTPDCRAMAQRSTDLPAIEAETEGNSASMHFAPAGARDSHRRHAACHGLEIDGDILDQLSRAELRALWTQEFADKPPACLGRDVLALAIALCETGTALRRADKTGHQRAGPSPRATVFPSQA
jgi:hypothetical protein